MKRFASVLLMALALAMAAVFRTVIERPRSTYSRHLNRMERRSWVKRHGGILLPDGGYLPFVQGAAPGSNFPQGISSFGVPVESLALGLSPYGDVWYVDGTNGSDTANNGRSPDTAYATLGQARTDSAAGDIIIIAPGTYTQTAAAEPLTPKARQVYIAAVHNPYRPTVIITGTAEAVVVDINVDGVVFAGIEFKADSATVDQLVRVANGAAVAGLTFLGCRLNGATFATVDGISAVHATQQLTGLIVERCLFDDLDFGIKIGVMGFPGSRVVNNLFLLRDTGGADVGISLADTTTSLIGYGYVIKDNDFIGPTDAGADAVGIVIAGTENTTALGIIRGNFFSYCTAAAITIDKLSLSEINNYYGDAATGGTLVDPGT